MADIDLPVFSFRPNWAEGVTETLSFRTNVLRGEEGAEQRQATRLTPRRSFTADFLLYGPERTFYDLFMHRLGALEVMVPLHWDVGRLSATTTPGVTDRLDFDTRWTEFAVGLALIQGPTALSYEVVEISAVDDTGVDLAAPVAGTWLANSRVIPIRRALIEDMGSLAHHAAEVATVSARFQFAVANPWVPDADGSTIYDGLPVFLNEPNWVEPLDVQLARDAIRLDNDTGLPFQLDPTGRANVGQAHRWFLPGRESLASFRDLLYRHKGRAGSFWLPTFKGDLKLVSPALTAATQIVVQNVGLQYCDVPTAGREHIAICLKDGTTILRQITDTDPGVTAATEKVDLDLAVGQDLQPGQVRKISFLDTARFDQDEFDLTHHTETTGLTEATGVFRTFKNSRDPAGVIDYPIPESEMTEGDCGGGGCDDQPALLCILDFKNGSYTLDEAPWTLEDAITLSPAGEDLRSVTYADFVEDVGLLVDGQDFPGTAQPYFYVGVSDELRTAICDGFRFNTFCGHTIVFEFRIEKTDGFDDPADSFAWLNWETVYTFNAIAGWSTGLGWDDTYFHMASLSIQIPESLDLSWSEQMLIPKDGSLIKMAVSERTDVTVVEPNPGARVSINGSPVVRTDPPGLLDTSCDYLQMNLSATSNGFGAYGKVILEKITITNFQPDDQLPVLSS